MFSIPKDTLSPKNRYTDADIQVFLASGLSSRKIAKIYHISPKRLARISKGEEAKPQGRPKISEDEKVAILELFEMEPRMTIHKARIRFHAR